MRRMLSRYETCDVLIANYSVHLDKAILLIVLEERVA